MKSMSIDEFPDLFEEVRELIQQGCYNLWEKPDPDSQGQYVLHVPRAYDFDTGQYASKLYGLDASGKVVTEIKYSDSYRFCDLTPVMLVDWLP